MAKPKHQTTNKRQMTVQKKKKTDLKVKDKLRKALNLSKTVNDSVILTPSKPKSVRLPSNSIKNSSFTKITAKPAVVPSEKNGFVENEVLAEVNGSKVQSLQSKNMPLKSRKMKRCQNGFVEESIDVTKLNTKKAKHNSHGFIETNLNSEEETKFVDRILQQQSRRISEALGVDPTIPMEKFSENVAEKKPTPSIVVHDVANGILLAANTASSASDSEDDNYIDQYFTGHDANDDFNSNDALSIDKFGKLSKRKRLSSSGSETNASASKLDESTITDDSDSNFGFVENATSTSEDSSKCSNHKKQMVHYNGNGDDSYDDDEDSDDYDDSDEYYEDTASDGYDFADYISDGDEEKEEQEEQESDCSMYEDHTSDYDDESSDRGHYGEYYESHSDSGRDEDDEYDDFMSGRYKDDSSDTDFYDSDYDDLVIARGSAISYKLTDSRIKLFENDTAGRIIELPKSDTEDEDCAELVSLNVTREEIVHKERHKRQTKKMHDDLVAFKAKQRESEYQQKYESYFKLDESQTTTLLLAPDAPTEDTKPVVITCLPGTVDVENVSLDECFANESTSETDSDQYNSGIDVNFMDQAVITTASLNMPPPMNVEIDDVEQSNISDDDEGTPERNSHARLMPVQRVFVDFSHTERNQNRNYHLTKSQMAKTKPQFFNSINSQHVLLLLRNIIHFHGNLQVKLIDGNAQVFGHQLERNKYVTVHSPRGHSLIYLVPTPPKRISSNNTTSFAALNELKTDFLAQDIDDLIAKFNQSTDAIILLERDTKHKGVNMIDRYMRETMFPNINAFNNESPYYSSEFILHCQFSLRPRNGLILNDAWSTVSLKNRSKLATIGGKGVGKSTFVRYTINSNINKFKKFVFIDLDIGQPELFVPQTISATLLTTPILGPGYLENIPPSKAIFFGEINVLLNPIKYLRCVAELYEFCSKCEAFQNIPWVINTMGYSRSLGSELMACILRIFQPTDVVQIQSETLNENFETIIDAEYANSYKFNIFDVEMANVDATCNFRTHTFNAITGNESSNKAKQTDMSPKDIRYAMILSKLGNCLRCNSYWLTSVRPFEVSLSDLRIILANGDKVDPAAVTDVLNANLVYLCESNAENSNDIVDCHGIGIVRAIDASTEKLYLLSSIPFEELAKVNALAISAIPLPSAVLLNQHGHIRGNVPFVYNTDGFVGSKQVAQHIFRSQKNRNNNPIELMEN